MRISISLLESKHYLAFKFLWFWYLRRIAITVSFFFNFPERTNTLSHLEKRQNMRATNDAFGNAMKNHLFVHGKNHIKHETNANSSPTNGCK